MDMPVPFSRNLWHPESDELFLDLRAVFSIFVLMN